MEPQVQAALITGVCTALIAPVIALFLKPWVEAWLEGKWPRSKESADLLRAITGPWEFKVSRDVGPDGGPKRLDVKLKVSRGRIEGEFMDALKPNSREEFSVQGELRKDRFIVLYCQPKRTEVIQFSVMVLRIHRDPKTMKGKLVGYGPGPKAADPFVEEVVCTKVA
jgi:hypothetical protein